MTTESVKKYSKEIAALGDGKVIQKRCNTIARGWSEWIDTSDPSFTSNPAYEFRTKPEQKECKEYWMVMNGEACVSIFNDEDTAKHYIKESSQHDYLDIVHVREVL